MINHQRMSLARTFYRLRTFVGQAYQNYGITFPLVALHRQGTCWKRRTIGPRGFELGGRYYHYSHHPYMFNSERTVEVGLVWDLLKGKTGSILEIGHVLSNYHQFPHTIVDKYEVAPGVLNEDIITYAPKEKFDFVAAISTLEHVGWDESPRTPEKILRAFQQVKSLIKDDGLLVVTMPMGYNDYLDQVVREQKLGFQKVLYLKRVSASNEWREATLAEIAQAKYNSPYPCANAVVVAMHGAVRS